MADVGDGLGLGLVAGVGDGSPDGALLGELAGGGIVGRLPGVSPALPALPALPAASLGGFGAPLGAFPVFPDGVVPRANWLI